MLYRIMTACGGWYIINEKGQVLQCDNGWNKIGASERELNTWVIVGAWFSRGFGSTDSISLDQLLKVTQFRYKDGEPIYGIIDVSNGNLRWHSSKDVCGIVSINRLSLNKL